jgi:hypothetical protein
MSPPKIAALSILALCALIDPASAQSCNRLAAALGISVDDLVDGVTYVRVGTTWRALTSPTELGLSGPTALEGIHVVKDVTGQPRVGVVIVKTGRVGPVSGPSSRRVSLVRISYNSCNPSVSVSSVSGEAYDGFHDYGYVNYPSSELAKLTHFHTAFGKDCKQRTDDDPGGFSRHYSNRSQFSYTEDVVDYGGYTGIYSLGSRLGFSRAVAEPVIAKIDRQTEIKSYSTANGFACLKVSVPYVDEGSFFRTNDLGATQVLSREKRYWKGD